MKGDLGMPRSRLLLVPLLLAAVLAACGGSAPATTRAPAPSAIGEPTSASASTAAPGAQLTVFAAASLTDAFKQIGQNFGAANGGAVVTFNFAGSDQLATQIT